MKNKKLEYFLGNLKVYSQVPKNSSLVKDNKNRSFKKFLKKSLTILFTATVMSSSILVGGVAKETIYLKRAGVSTRDALHASIYENYVQPELDESVKEIDKLLEDRFPNINFHNSGSTVLSSDDWNNSISVDELAGFYNGIYDVAVYNSNYPERYAHENFHRRTRHTVINEKGEKEEYNGLMRLRDGKGSKLNEALTAFIEKDLYGNNSSYFESRYLQLIFYFIPIEPFVKIAAEGSMNDLELLFSQLFDCDIVDLIDKTPGEKELFAYGKDYVIKELTYRANAITDAFYKWISISNEDDESKMKRIKLYREYLTKNFAKSVSYFDEVFKNYTLGGISK